MASSVNCIVNTCLANWSEGKVAQVQDVMFMSDNVSMLWLPIFPPMQLYMNSAIVVHFASEALLQLVTISAKAHIATCASMIR